MGKWRIAIWVAIVIATLAFLYAVRSILLPFILAWIIAVMLEPLVRKLRLRGFSRAAAANIITASAFVVFGTALFFAVPRVSKQVNELRISVQNLSDSFSRERANDNIYVRWNPVVLAQPPGALGFVDNALQEFEPFLSKFDLPTTRRALMDQYVEPHIKDIGKSVQTFFNGFLGIVGGAASQMILLLFTPIFVFYLLQDMEQMKIRMAGWIPPPLRANTLSLLNDIGDVFNRYLRGVVTAILSYTLVMMIVLTVLGAPYSILLALLAGIVYLIPYLGGWISTMTILLVTGFSGKTGNWFYSADTPWGFAIVIAGLFCLCSITFDQLVYPQLVGGAVKLNPLVSFFVILSGGALFGLPGMIIAFPLAGAIKVTLARLLRLTNSQTADGLRMPAIPLRHRTSTET